MSLQLLLSPARAMKPGIVTDLVKTKPKLWLCLKTTMDGETTIKTMDAVLEPGTEGRVYVHLITLTDQQSNPGENWYPPGEPTFTMSEVKNILVVLSFAFLCGVIVGLLLGRP